MLKAVIDCGASESIVGDCMLQDYCEELERLGFDTEQEVMVDRDVRRNFLFGNSATSTALGLAKVTAGVCGNEVPLDFMLSKETLCFCSLAVGYMIRRLLSTSRLAKPHSPSCPRTRSNWNVLLLSTFCCP